MPLLPPERDPVLIIDSKAVTVGLFTLQPLQTIASRDGEILQSRSHVEHLELPLDDTP
jgi:hypothetical protein